MEAYGEGVARAPGGRKSRRHQPVRGVKQMSIARHRIIAALRERGQQTRADWVERELPERVDPAKHVGLLATLRLDPADLADTPSR
ncbi:hypothetical protein SAMN05443287_10623 [Micromonospora phaseoli]|uniref:Uncharacterized protein n=2 Tax=Micromonospora phaseoli TaxID=1144548 RepID=A0A1H7AFS4_9ACTN|nr:hypothetical protein CLV64_107365 [Micromonospora phaseoli]SEJ62717.1 hypothetical protein SAMN05443287_10623 [Micromonospora phaseoli]